MAGFAKDNSYGDLIYTNEDSPRWARARRRSDDGRIAENIPREIALDVPRCVEIKILRRARAESSRRPSRHRRDACSMAW